MQRVEPYVLAWWYYGTAKDNTKAAQLARYALRHAPIDDDAWAYNLLGVIDRHNGRLEQKKGNMEKFKEYIDNTRNKFGKAIAVDSRLEITYNNIEVLFSDESDHKNAIVNYRKAISLNSGKAYPVVSGVIDILYVMGLVAAPIRSSERNAAGRLRRRFKRNTNSSR